MDLRVLRQKVVATARLMNASGINQGTSGNLSVRISGGMLITPSSIPYEGMEPSDLIPIGFDGSPLASPLGQEREISLRPSSEWRFHADILASRPEIQAVLHCHSINATALACHGKGIPSFHYMTAVAGGADIRCASYATFGTSELSKNALKALEGRFACLLEKHGLISIGPGLDEAFRIAIEVETLAEIYLKACQIGEPSNLSKEEMKTVMSKFEKMSYGNKKISPSSID